MSASDQALSRKISRRETTVHTSIRRLSWLGLILAAVMFGGFLVWGAFANLQGAVIAQGMVVVQSNLRKVQHPTGGVIGQILVKDGQSVQEGDVLLRLDETVTKANLAIVTDQMTQFYGRKARLEAERDGNAEITFPEELLRDAGAESVKKGETSLFFARRVAREGQAHQLGERIAQLNEEIIGLTEQAAAKATENVLIGKELVGVNELYAKNLVPLTRVTQLQREEARLMGERGQVLSQIASSRGKISETELQILAVDRDMQSEVTKDLRDVEAKLAELRERKVAAEDQLRRVVLYAPVSGLVHQLTVHTVGGVVQAGEVLMMIVPENDTLLIEARIPPNDIEPVKVGGVVHLKFPALNQRTTPEIDGKVMLVSADVVQATNASVQAQPRDPPFYIVQIEVPPDEVNKLGEHKILPGMPAEAFIATADRNALSYFVRPLLDQLSRVFRDK